MTRQKKGAEVSKSSSKIALTSDGAHFFDTYTSRDYEVVLDILYGLFNQEDAVKVRVYDPFIADAERAPLVTPRMLVERIESLLIENANA